MMKLARSAFAVAVVGVLLASSCSGGDSAKSTAASVAPSDDSTWGPLAVVQSGGAGGDALIEGTIDTSEGCVVLVERGERVLLVWPSTQTSWDSESATIHFESGQLGAVSLADGDTVRMGGGGSSAAEGGPGAAAFLASIDWIAPPPLACVTDTRWFVVDLVN